MLLPAVCSPVQENEKQCPLLSSISSDAGTAKGELLVSQMHLDPVFYVPGNYTLQSTQPLSFGEHGSYVTSYFKVSDEWACVFRPHQACTDYWLLTMSSSYCLLKPIKVTEIAVDSPPVSYYRSPRRLC
jgi:hypothetical protein